MAKNLDHSTPSSQPTPKRQTLESAIARFLERRQSDDEREPTDAAVTDEAAEADEVADGPEIVIVDPIEKTQESPIVIPPEPARRGGVPAFLAQDVAEREGIEDTAMRAAPDARVDVEGEAEGVAFDEMDDGAYEGEFDDEGFAYNEDEAFYEGDYDDGYYEDYEGYEDELPGRRGVRRGVVAALVAGVAVVSFVAGGLAARLFTQAPAAPAELPTPIETQASLTEKPDQTTQTTIDTNTDDKEDTSTTSEDKSTVKLHTDKKPDAPSYDTGNDTTDDSKRTDTTKKQDTSSSERNDSSKNTDRQDGDTWSWQLDDTGDNTISYDRKDREMTFDYDGYQLTVPMGDLVDTYDQTYGTNQNRRNTDSTRDNSGYRGYDYGNDGYGTGWTRNRSETDYQRKYGSWS